MAPPLGRPRRGDRPDRPQGLPAPAQRRSLASGPPGRCWPSLLVAAVSASVWLVFFSSYVTAEDVEVTGTATLGDRRIERAADVPIGTPLARVDLDAIRARVESISAVTSAEVPRSWPHGVHIDVTERTPIAVVDQGEGLQALDDDGVLFGHYDTRPRRTAAGDGTRRHQRRGAGRGRPGDRLAAGRRSPRGSTPSRSTASTRSRWCSATDAACCGGAPRTPARRPQVLAVLLQRPGQQIDVTVPGRPTTR